LAGAEEGRKRKMINILHGEVFFLLTIPLMGDPFRQGKYLCRVCVVGRMWAIPKKQKSRTDKTGNYKKALCFCCFIVLCISYTPIHNILPP
jgi:hypothetical protein